jgi:hypothetical protein
MGPVEQLFICRASWNCPGGVHELEAISSFVLSRRGALMIAVKTSMPALTTGQCSLLSCDGLCPRQSPSGQGCPPGRKRRASSVTTRHDSGQNQI